MGTNVRVTIKRQELIDAVKQRRAAAWEEWRQDKATFDERMARYQRTVAAALTAVAKEARAGKLNPDKAYGERIEVNVGERRPERPPSRPDLKRFDRMVQHLELGQQDTLSLTEDAVAHYLGGGS